MTSKHAWQSLLALLAGCSLLLAGCGVAPTQTTSPLPRPTGVNTPAGPQPEEAPTVEPTEAGEETMYDSPVPQAASLVEEAKQDLSSRLQIEAGRINLESVEAMQWRDSSLGCPQPGRNYLTVITPGFQIILSVDGREYDYRTDLQRVILCKP